MNKQKTIITNLTEIKVDDQFDTFTVVNITGNDQMAVIHDKKVNTFIENKKIISSQFSIISGYTIPVKNRQTTFPPAMMTFIIYDDNEVAQS